MRNRSSSRAVFQAAFYIGTNGIHSYSQREVDRINSVTKKVGNVYNKMYQKLLDGSQESNLWKSQLGLPVQTLDAANVSSDF